MDISRHNSPTAPIGNQAILGLDYGASISRSLQRSHAFAVLRAARFPVEHLNTNQISKSQSCANPSTLREYKSISDGV
jgi:hypothetical protein